MRINPQTPSDLIGSLQRSEKAYKIGCTIFVLAQSVAIIAGFIWAFTPSAYTVVGGLCCFCMCSALAISLVGAALAIIGTAVEISDLAILLTRKVKEHYARHKFVT